MTDSIKLMKALGAAEIGSDELDREVCAYLGMKRTTPVTQSFEAGVAILPRRCGLEILYNDRQTLLFVHDGDEKMVRVVGTTPALTLALALVACRQRYLFAHPDNGDQTKDDAPQPTT